MLLLKYDIKKLVLAKIIFMCKKRKHDKNTILLL